MRVSKWQKMPDWSMIRAVKWSVKPLEALLLVLRLVQPLARSPAIQNGVQRLGLLAAEREAFCGLFLDPAI